MQTSGVNTPERNFDYLSNICNVKTTPKYSLNGTKLGFYWLLPLWYFLVQKFRLLLKHVEKNCHVLTKWVPPGSSKAIAHGIGKHRQFQNQLLVSLHADICLLRLPISLSHKYFTLPPDCWKEPEGEPIDVSFF